ncbi:hypothetical protein GCM10027396_10900 [Insolitispirillum peregrinum]
MIRMGGNSGSQVRQHWGRVGQCMTHADLWLAIDALARRHGYSVSGLAKAAGLDPTTFNWAGSGNSDRVIS